MSRCFVMQPFDGGRFDSRFDDVFAPAIAAAKLEPYRVDRDPSSVVPIEDIQAGIAEARICLAEITTDNPNVWFEIGYAIACKKSLVFVCSDERESPFPFDVRHRAIIKYACGAPRDFDELREKITAKLNAELAKEQHMEAALQMSSVADVEGLQPHEIATLVAVAEETPEPTAGVSAYIIQKEMEQVGFRRIATTLGVRSLLTKRLLEAFE